MGLLSAKGKGEGKPKATSAEARQNPIGCYVLLNVSLFNELDRLQALEHRTYCTTDIHFVQSTICKRTIQLYYCVFSNANLILRDPRSWNISSTGPLYKMPKLWEGWRNRGWSSIPFSALGILPRSTGSKTCFCTCVTTISNEEEHFRLAAINDGKH